MNLIVPNPRTDFNLPLEYRLVSLRCLAVRLGQVIMGDSNRLMAVDMCKNLKEYAWSTVQEYITV